MDKYLRFESAEQAQSVLYTEVRPAGYIESTDEQKMFVYKTADGYVSLPVEYSYAEAEELGYDLVSPDEAWELKPNFQNIDTIGTIYEPTGEMLMGEDGEYPEMAPIEGWHVNVRLAGEDGSSLEPYAVTPTQPVRVWG